MDVWLCTEVVRPPSHVVRNLVERHLPLSIGSVCDKRVLESYEIKHTVKTDGRD